VTTLRYLMWQRPSQGVAEVERGYRVRVVKGRENEVGDRHATDEVVGNLAGIAHLDEVEDLPAREVRVDVGARRETVAPRVNQHLEHLMADRDAQVRAVDCVGVWLPLVIQVYTPCSW